MDLPSTHFDAPSAKRQKVDGPGTFKPSNGRTVKLRATTKDPDVGTCAICLNTLREPYSTTCGHTFCHSCITASLEVKRRCPTCSLSLPEETSTVLIPNFAAAQKIAAAGTALLPLTIDSGDMSPLLRKIASSDISQDSLDEIISTLCKKREEMLCGEKKTTSVLVDFFLDEMVRKRECEISTIERELDLIRSDKSALEKIRASSEAQTISNPSLSASALVPEGTSAPITVPSPLFALLGRNDIPLSDDLMQRLTTRILKHYDALQAVYVGVKQRIAEGNEEAQVAADTRCNATKMFGREPGIIPEMPKTNAEYAFDEQCLGAFGEVIRGVVQYAEMEQIASLNYDVETVPQLSIVSSLEFDKDGENFVVAGVTKRIKIFDYESVVNNPQAIHYPLGQLKCRNKISNISWNPYQKHILCSSDYDGNVVVWDTNTTQVVKTFKEHQKRCWTVNFNNVDPHLIASGSDDSKVKLWSLNSERSVNTIDAKVNVCCVHFSPTSRHHLVFGCADHAVHLYDIRQTSQPLNVFKGHRKAVSYVRYINENQVVSASTDSSLRVWCARTGKCTRVLRGHTNEKNFVGLSGNGDHVICGSENSQAYVYHKEISDPLACQFVGNSMNKDEEPGFVSSVCWKKNSDIALMANSVGKVQIFRIS